ncbi:MAG: HDOD domain-containing protein [Mariprofundaceae bacterium]
MSDDRQKKLLVMVEGMPAFPKSVQRILELTAGMDCSPKELVQVIEHDPVMMMKLLKLVNSAFFGLSREVTSINHAVIYIGINTIKNLALSVATMGMLPRTNKAAYDTHGFLLHSLTTASISVLLSGRTDIGNEDPGDFFVAGLLHDFGKMVFALFMPDEFGKALTLAADGVMPLHEAELQMIGSDHTEIGAMLADQWELPQRLASAIREHHSPASGGVLQDCLSTANMISKHLAFGVSGNYAMGELTASASDRFGDDLVGLVDTLGDLSGEMVKAQAFISI